MVHLMHFMQILRLSDEVIKTYGRYPDERDRGLRSAREIYKAAFGELIRQGMPYTREAGLLRIETDGEEYAVHESSLAAMHIDAAGEGKTYSAPIPAAPHEPYGPYHESEDEDLDVTRVMSFTEAMDSERTDHVPDPESADEDYVQPAGDLLKEDEEDPGPHDDSEGHVEGNAPEGQQEGSISYDGNPGDPSDENEGLSRPDGTGPSTVRLEEDDMDDWKANEDSYSELAEEPGDEGYDEPDDGPEDDEDENDGIIIPPEENGMMDGPGAAEDLDEPETRPNEKTTDPEDENKDAGAADTQESQDDAEVKALSDARLSDKLQDVLGKDDFTYSSGRIIIETPNGSEERAAVLSMPLSLDTDSPEFILYCIIERGKKAYVSKGRGEKILNIAGYRVAFSAWVDAEGNYGTGCRLDGSSAAIGASLTYKVKHAGSKGHIVLGDEEGTIRIHAMPTNFKNTEMGQPAAVLYYVETLDGEESYDIARPQTPIRFPYEGGYMKAGFVWEKGVLNGGVLPDN